MSLEEAKAPVGILESEPEPAEGTQVPAANTPESGVEHKVAPAVSRELSVAALMHLAGLPTAAQVRVVEAKLDALTSKISAIGTRLERLAALVESSQVETLFERIDYQLAEVRTMLKKTSSHVGSSAAPSNAGENGNAKRILSSSPEEEEEIERATKARMKDDEFQRTESSRMREAAAQADDAKKEDL